MKARTGTILLGALMSLSVFLPSICSAADQRPLIGKGINLDCEITNINKVGYDPGFHEAFKQAGFDSVRFFVKLGYGPMAYKDAIDDALNMGLTVVIVGWAGEANGRDALVDFWREYAQFYRMYPKQLVFELLNEPELTGHKRGEEAKLMSWLNDCILAIRETNPTRVIAVGGPSYNGVDYLVNYVTPKYLNFRLSNGTGFAEDENLMGIFHTYDPHRWTHSERKTSLNEVSPNWKKNMVVTLDKAQEWARQYNKPVMLSEWGARLTNDLNDVEEYCRFVVEECGRRNIEWMYYCGAFSNAWAFSLFNSEYGWKDSAAIVKVLTGVTPPTSAPSTSQILNPSFTMDAADWWSTDSVVIGTADHEGVGGSRAIRCTVRYGRPAPALYQQLDPEWRFKADGKYLIQLREGNTYRISFYAKCDYNTTSVRVQFGHAPDNDPVVWTSTPVQITTDFKEYELTYVHDSGSVDSARFSVLFEDPHCEIILDDIKLRSSRAAR